mgnify:FL=1|tara:strand:+ start:936 stop:1517 length:582 start_codon:yes stop_codon:yes gene_type:complete
MDQLIGNKKVKTAVFISGTGSNLKNLINFSINKKSPISINLIISDNKNAIGLKYGKIFNIKKKVVNFRNKEIAEKKIFLELKKNNINFVCLAGFMRILSKNFFKNFKGKIINIHPSLLPKYKGLNTHKRTIKNNEKFSGCTVHYVTPKLDSGKIILQKKVVIKKNDTEKSLAKRILIQEHKLYSKAISKIFSL